MAGSSVEVGPFCEHGLSTSFPCGKCRKPKRIIPSQVPYVVLVVGLIVLGLVFCVR